MPEEVRLWQIENDKKLHECTRSPLDLESRLEDWIEHDVSILASNLIVIGRQVETSFGGFIDLLCIDDAGDLVIVELKRDKTPREVTAQILDYASWVKDLSREHIIRIADGYLGRQGAFEEEFRHRFGDLPSSLNEDHRMLIVASVIDSRSERIIRYLSDGYGVNINAATFQYFQSPDRKDLLARVFLIEPSQVEERSLTKGTSKKRRKLTEEELEEIVEQNGIGEIYWPLVAGLEQHFRKEKSENTIMFNGTIDGSRSTFVTLFPKESNPKDGLRFQIYSSRLANFFGLSEEQILNLLPEKREPKDIFSQ